MISSDEISAQFVLLILIFLVIGLMYFFFLIATYFRVWGVMSNNKNYVGKLFYIFKFLLCACRVGASVTICYFLITGTDTKKDNFFKNLLLNILYIPQVLINGRL